MFTKSCGGKTKTNYQQAPYKDGSIKMLAFAQKMILELLLQMGGRPAVKLHSYEGSCVFGSQDEFRPFIP